MKLPLFTLGAGTLLGALGLFGYGLWMTQPQTQTELKTVELQSVLRRIVVRPDKSPPLAYLPESPEARNEEPLVKLASVKEQLARLGPGQYPDRLLAVRPLFQIHSPLPEAADFALRELTAFHSVPTEAPYEWKIDYVDTLMKAYLTHAGTRDGMALLAQLVADEKDPDLKQILEERYALNKIPDLERAPSSE